MEGNLPHTFRVVKKTRENRTTVALLFDGALSAAPGQFAMVWLPGVDEKPFSIAGTDPLELVISRVGPFSEALCALEPGDTLSVRGPFGKGFSVALGHTLLVGGGYGAAPLHLLSCALLAEGVSVEVALGARTAADLLFRERFAEHGIPVHVATEDGSAGVRGRVTDVVSSLLSAQRFDRLRACGPEGMLESLASLCRGAGVPAELSYEAYMRCGIGICGACEHGARLVCMDGPVFMT
jgi:dihydroorotate dehydrogenase electron transfer subunit